MRPTRVDLRGEERGAVRGARALGAAADSSSGMRIVVLCRASMSPPTLLTLAARITKLVRVVFSHESPN